MRVRGPETWICDFCGHREIVESGPPGGWEYFKPLSEDKYYEKCAGCLAYFRGHQSEEAMRDIVERLRELALSGVLQTKDEARTVLEAADTIERLRSIAGKADPGQSFSEMKRRQGSDGLLATDGRRQ